MHSEGLGGRSEGGGGLFVPSSLDRDLETFGGGGGKSIVSHLSYVVDESESELCLSSKSEDKSGRKGRGGVESTIAAVGEQAGLGKSHDVMVMSGRGGGSGMFLMESEVLEDKDVEEDDTEERREDFLSGTFGFGLPAGDFALIREVTGVPAVGVLD